MTEKMKVSELPQEEQDALINEGKSLNIRGIINAKTWCVDTLKAKIAEAKTNQPSSADNNNGQENGNTAKTPVQDEQNQPVNNPVETPVKQEEESLKADKPDEKVLICHICRSRVKNGKCTGCGFEVFK